VDPGFELVAPVVLEHVSLVELVEVLDAQMLGNWQELV
jgi:hypothetical protein